MRRTIRVLAFLVTPLAVSGCGSSHTVQVTGKLLKGGARYTAPDWQRLGLTLLAMEVKDGSGKTVAANEPYAAEVDPTDGTFRVPGPEGRGVPPGKYRVSITQRLNTAMVDAKLRTTRRGALPFDRETDYLKN